MLLQRCQGSIHVFSSLTLDIGYRISQCELRFSYELSRIFQIFPSWFSFVIFRFGFQQRFLLGMISAKFHDWKKKNRKLKSTCTLWTECFSTRSPSSEWKSSMNTASPRLAGELTVVRLTACSCGCQFVACRAAPAVLVLLTTVLIERGWK